MKKICNKETKAAIKGLNDLIKNINALNGIKTNQPKITAIVWGNAIIWSQ